MNKIFFNILFYLLFTNFFSIYTQAQINNVIVAKVGDSILSSVDIQNEIITNLVLANKEITQININNNKNYATKNIINKLIKRSEITKYEIKDYNKKDLSNYIENVSKNLNTNIKGLKEKFKANNIDYKTFIKNYETELLWNTLIYKIYSNQININIVEVENDVNKLMNTDQIEYNLSEIEVYNFENKKKKINEILQSIKKEGFDITAKKLSDSRTAKNGGLIGWVSNKSLSKKFIAAIKDLKRGEITSPIFEEQSIIILMLNDIKKSKNVVEVEKVKKNILLRKKEEKLGLFSRSHFSSLKNSIQIDFL